MIGMVQGKYLVVVNTMRGETHRMIAARRANREETNACHKNRSRTQRPVGTPVDGRGTDYFAARAKNHNHSAGAGIDGGRIFRDLPDPRCNTPGLGSGPERTGRTGASVFECDCAGAKDDGGGIAAAGCGVRIEARMNGYVGEACQLARRSRTQQGRRDGAPRPSIFPPAKACHAPRSPLYPTQEPARNTRPPPLSRAHRLAVQDVALSRRKQGFDSPWAHQNISTISDTYANRLLKVGDFGKFVGSFYRRPGLSMSVQNISRKE